MLFADYVQTLTPAQHEIINSVIANSRMSKATAGAAKGIREKTAQCLLEFWGDTFPQADKIALGYEPNWQEINIEWELSMQCAFENQNGWLSKLVGWMGLTPTILNFIFGLNLPKSLSKEQEEKASVAIIVGCITVAPSTLCI